MGACHGHDHPAVTRLCDRPGHCGPLDLCAGGALRRALIERSLRILERRSLPFWREGLDGPLPLTPPALGESELKVDYVTPIGQAQKAVQVESMARVIEGVERLSAFDRALPGIVNAEAAVREIADIYNAPMDMLNAPEAVAALRQQQAEAAEAQQAASLGAEQAGAMKDLAQAARVVGGA